MKANNATRKKLTIKMLVCAAAAVLAVLLAGGARVYAADAPAGTVTNLVQTGATAGSVDIQFTALTDAEAQYAVYVSSNEAGGYAEKESISGNFTTISGLAAGSTYYVMVVPFYENSDSTQTSEKDSVSEDEQLPSKLYGTASAALSVVTAPSTAPTSITQKSSTSDSVTIAWDAVNGASGYFVDYALSDSTSQERVRLVTNTAGAVLTGLSASKTYTAYVTPYRVSREGFTAYDSANCTSKGNLMIGSVTSGKPAGKVSGFVQKTGTADSAAITFRTLSDASAQYSVQLAESADGSFSEYAVVKEGTCAFTELKAGASYYVRVVPFYQSWNSLNEEYDRVNGTASDVFEIVTVPSARPKTITQTDAAKTSIKLQWDAVDGATGYTVDYYRSGSSESLTTTVSKNKVKLSGLTANAEYSVYVTPYRRSASGFTAVDETNYTGKYNIPVKPSKAGKVTVRKYWQSLGKVNLKTKKIACADGYQYVLYTSGKATDKKIAQVTAAGSASANLKSTKLKKAGTFKVTVRAYITVGGKKVYGAWSDWTYFTAR
jgi:hypothetical protein